MSRTPIPSIVGKAPLTERPVRYIPATDPAGLAVVLVLPQNELVDSLGIVERRRSRT